MIVGLRFAECYGFPIYDAMIVATATVATALVSFIRFAIKWTLAGNKISIAVLLDASGEPCRKRIKLNYY